MEPVYKRVLLKVSGEALAGEKGTGFNDEMLLKVANQIKEIHDIGVEVAVVCGGGNFWRGRTSGNMDRCTADYIGMLATVMNSMAVADALRQVGVDAVVQTAFEMTEIADQFSVREAREKLSEGKVVIFGAGIGSPYFSTDTTAALRAIEIEADVILLGKKVDAVYSADPEIDKDAIKYDAISHMEVIEQDLKVMDLTAAVLCKDNNMNIHVFGLADDGNIMKALCGEKIGTVIS